MNVLASVSKESQIVDLADCIRRRSHPEHQQLFSGLYGLFQEQGPAMSDEVAELLDQLLMTIIEDVEIQIRSKVAADLARQERVPQQVLDYLARDDIRVAHQILQYSNALSDKQLMEIAADATEGHRMAIAARANLSAEVSEVLVEIGELRVSHVLLNNINAAINERSIEMLVNRSRTDEKLAKLLLGRPELSAEHAHTMFWWVSSSLRDIILQNFDIDVEVIDNAVRKATHEALLERREDPFHLVSGKTKKPLGPDEIEEFTNLFRTLEGQQLVERLAEIMDIRTATAERILNDRTGEALAVCCKALNANRQQFVRIFLVLDYSWFGKIRPMGHLQRITFIYDTLTADKARRTLSFWDLQDLADEAA